MGFLGLFKPRFELPPPRFRLIVFCPEEILPLPVQIAHPDGLSGAPVGVPEVLAPQPLPEFLLEQPMEPGGYLFQGHPADVLATVERRHRGSPYPGREAPRLAGSPAGVGAAERARLENAVWTVTLELAKMRGEIGGAVLYQMQLADRLAMLAEGAVLDQVAHRYYLPGRWRIANPIKPVDAREHVVLHLEVAADDTLWAHTHGLSKFGRPELEALGLPHTLGEVACRVMIDLAQRLIGGAVMRPGERVGDPESPLFVRVGRNGSVDHYTVPSLELVDMGPGGKPLERGASRGISAYYRGSASHLAGSRP